MDASEGVDGEIEEVAQKPAPKESRLYDLDKHNNNGHMRKRTLKQVESNFDLVSNKNSPFSSRAQNHSHRSIYNRSKQNAKYSTEEKELLAKIPTRIEKDNRDFQNRSQKGSEKSETKGGEILEAGELADGNEATEKQRAYLVKAHAEGMLDTFLSVYLTVIWVIAVLQMHKFVPFISEHCHVPVFLSFLFYSSFC